MSSAPAIGLGLPHIWAGKSAQRVAAAVGLALLVILPWQAAVIVGTTLWHRIVLILGRTRPAQALAACCEAFLKRAARRLLRDERNYIYLYSVFGLGTLMPLCFAGSYYLQCHVLSHFSLLALFAYHVMLLGPYFLFFGHVSTLVHHEGHAEPHGLFRPRFAWLNGFFGSFLGMLYGHVPGSYPLGHVRIHHSYDNGLDDVITTLHLDRRRPSQFLVYLPQFALYWTGFSIAAYYARRRLWSPMSRMLVGMFMFYGAGTLLAVADWRFAVGYWLLPQGMTILFLSAVAYTWHAFADPDNAADDYVGTVTILDGQYNVFNEDYHVVHHQAPQLHWSEYPDHFSARLDEYRRHCGSVFRNTQVLELFFWIVLRRYDLMATHFVDMGYGLTLEQIKELLQQRLQPVK